MSSIYEHAGVNASVLSRISGVSRSAIHDYEHGQKSPTLRTLQRLLEPVRLDFAIVDADNVTPRMVTQHTHGIDLITSMQTTAEIEIRSAWDRRSDILDAECASERLQVTWGQVTTLMEGISVDGEPLDVERAVDVRSDLVSALDAAESGRPPALRTIIDDVLISSETTAHPVVAALDFLARSIMRGADPLRMLHRANSTLLSEGYPWLGPSYRRVDDFRQALVACRRGNAEPLVLTLIPSLAMSR